MVMMIVVRKKSGVSGCITIMGMDRVTRAVTVVEQQATVVEVVEQSRADLGGQ